MQDQRGITRMITDAEIQELCSKHPYCRHMKEEEQDLLTKDNINGYKERRKKE